MTLASDFKHEIEKEVRVNVVTPLNNAVRASAQVGYDQVTRLYREGGRTPINTGMFRSAWRVTLTRQSEYCPNEAKVVTRPRTSIWAPDQFSSEYDASRVASERAISLFSVGSHKQVFLTNNTSYAHLIEYGGNRIGPHAVLSTALAKMKVVLDTKLGR